MSDEILQEEEVVVAEEGKEELKMMKELSNLD